MKSVFRCFKSLSSNFSLTPSIPPCLPHTLSISGPSHLQRFRICRYFSPFFVKKMSIRNVQYHLNSWHYSSLDHVPVLTGLVGEEGILLKSTLEADLYLPWVVCVMTVDANELIWFWLYELLFQIWVLG